MDQISLLADALERKTKDHRTIHALDLLLSGAVQPGSRIGLWQVASKNDDRTYATMTMPREECTCRDARNYCKHVRAAKMASHLVHQADIQASAHGTTVRNLIDRLTADIAAGIPSRLSRALNALLIGALLNRQIYNRDAANAAADARDGESEPEHKPQRIELIIQFRTSGGRHNPTVDGDGELLEIRADGVKRPAKYADVNRAYRWMQTEGYEPAGHRWIDQAGYSRRRVSTYLLPGSPELAAHKDTALPVRAATRGRNKLFKT